MRKNFFYKIFTIAGLTLSSLCVSAQEVNTLYFMENVPVRSTFNPSFQSSSNFYIGVPLLGNLQYGLWSNSVSLKDLVYKINGKSAYFLNARGDKTKLYNTLKSSIITSGELRMSLINLGFRTSKSYWTFGLAERVDMYSNLPKEAARLFLYGASLVEDNNFNLTSLDLKAMAYTELSAGYARVLTDKLSVGANAKVLMGNAVLSSSGTKLNVKASIEQWSLKGISSFDYAGPMSLDGTTYSNLKLTPSSTSGYLKPSGYGLGIDIGATYKAMSSLTLSAALLDLGAINWFRNVANTTHSVDYTYTGLKNLDLNSNPSPSVIVDSILHALETSTQTTIQRNNFTTYLSPKMNLGAEYALLKNKLSVGVLSQTALYPSALTQEIVISANGRPCDWLNTSLSYSLLNGRGRSVGLAASVRTGSVNWFAGADFVPFNYATYSVSAGGVKMSLPVSYETKRMNFSFGVNIVLGNKKDEDHDGVENSKDKCPLTPDKVSVDANGCPHDSDGDGVSDYLDRCPNTPKEAFGRVSTLGCPLDTDLDNVPDYKDKCPNTPKELILDVDEKGCVKDTLHTPMTQKMDSALMPLKKDTLLSKSSALKAKVTPVVGAKIKTGTLVPVLAQPQAKLASGSTSNGGKNVKSVSAKSDQLNKMVSGNKLVPAVKNVTSAANAENANSNLRDLFQKAFQGVYFEAGTSRIRSSSFGILNQIVEVLMMHPDYKVEVRGHCDNKEVSSVKAKELSLSRAKVVKQYLVRKGIGAEQLTVGGYGATTPISDNRTENGRTLNRRVEFLITYKEINFE